MTLWLLTAAAFVSFLNAANAACSNNPCTGTDFRTYSSCLSNQCPNTVVATGCPESKCSSIDCNTCSSSSSCCSSCCRPKCECSSVTCHNCHSSSACCNTCCQKQDCCSSKSKEECCVSHPHKECCKDKTPSPTPIIPNIILPNITIVLNQSAPVVYNTLNQTCGGVTTVRNSTHIVTTTGTCTNQTTTKDPCCNIIYQPPCPFPNNPYPICPPPVHNYACGPQCIIQPQVLIPPPPQVIPTVIQPPAFVPPPPPPPPPPVTGCYHYPINQCPQQCYGHCHWPRQSGCLPIQQWPFVRCGYGGSIYGGIGGISGYGGYGGFGGYGGYGGYGGGYGGQIGYGGFGAGVQPFAG